MASTTDVLECLLCGGRFSVADVKQQLYYPSTGVCHGCYVEGQKKSHALWCFGKLVVIRRGGTRYGYDEEAKECRSLCPDRVVCRHFVKKRRKKDG